MAETDLTRRRAQLSAAKRALLEKRLRGQDEGQAGNQIIRRRDASAHAPLSFAQQRLWFLHQLEPYSFAYNMPTALRLTGPLKIDALERSIGEIVRRHQSLRTSFRLVDNRPVQVIAPQLSVNIPVIELAELPRVEREAEVSRLITEETRRPFDIENGPLVRLCLFRLGAQEHVLLLTMHHIISDGWSMGVLVREVAALYKAYTEGAQARLEELPIQYADFAEWQREWLTGENLERQLQYWKRQLGGPLPVLEMPADKPRPPRQGFRGAVRRFELPAALSSALRKLSREEGATLFMTTLAAFQALLQRYTNQDDILVGTAIANRNRAEIEGLIGFFVNTLVLRADLSGNPTFRELLRRVRDVTLAAYAHQDLPFERLVEELQPPRDLSRNPIFQVSFALQNAPMQELELPGLTLRQEEFESLTTRFDLELHLWDLPEGLQGFLCYNTELFEEATIARLDGHYRRLLEELVADADARVAEVGFLSADEQRQLLVEWNDTRQACARDLCVHQLFEERAAQTPDAVALLFEGGQFTYDELNRRANRLAHYLRRLGVTTETRVGLCVERSPEMLIGLLGILKAGGCYVPLDARYPLERLSFMLEDSLVSVLVTQEELLERLPVTHAQLVSLDGDRDAISVESEENPACYVTADNLIYVMYTSGSTGRPKGVAVTHRAVVRLVIEADYARLDAEQVMLQYAPISFDASTFEIWGSLLNGGRLALMPDGLSSLEELGRALMRYEVTTLWLTAGLFQLMVEERAEDLQGVRQLLAGGDVLSATHVERALRALPQCRVINGYGPTESTTFACCYPLTDSGRIGQSIPIGRPIGGTQAYILNKHLQLAPVGAVGELYIGGEGLARGYLNRPELTAERFIPHPHSAEAGARLYRTGDLVRRLADGNIEFLGRADEQVKLRGFRIELGEIEAALREHVRVRDVVVVVAGDERGEKRLLAYVVAPGERAQVSKELREYLKERLPEYMIPSAFVMLEALPLTANGKIDRRALPAPVEAQAEQADDGGAPATPVEELLAAIWSELLGVGRIGVRDDFFLLGGHSLLVTQLVSRVRESLGVELPVQSVFETPTVAELAAQVEAALRDRTGTQSPPVAPVAREGDIPLSFAQQRLWFLHELEPTSSFYNVPVAVRLKGHLDTGALERTLNEIIKRHESLRTSFPVVDGQPAQLIAQALRLSLPVVELTALPHEEREREAQRRATEDARAPFDLATGPLLRASLLRLDRDDHVLLVTMHHIVSDGWSMGVLVREVSALYRAFAEGHDESPLPELPVQYADFSVWQRRWLSGDVFETHLRYWKRQLGGDLPVLDLPTDKPRPEVQSFRGASKAAQLPPALVESLKALCRREGVTLFMLLLAAFKTLLRRYTGQDDIVIGSPIANRNRVELEGLIGFFVNTLVLRTDLSGNPTFLELLKRVRAVALEAYAHQDMPFEQLVEQMQPERTMSRNPLFQVMFQVENTPKADSTLPGLTLSPVEVERVTTQFDLSFDLMEREDALVVIAEYSTDLFNEATIADLLRRWRIMLEGIARDPSTRIAELPLLAEEERAQLLSGWNETRREFPDERAIHELFEAQAELRPEAWAVVCGREHLTFEELNRRANRLAHFLRERGVGPETVVGILLDRSTQMASALLGVLKAGGAYLPLDPAYPRERLAFMLEDAKASALLTEQRFSEKLQELTVPSIYLDAEGELLTRACDANPAHIATAQNLAYVIYTSGSTGRPKGVAVSHQSLVNHSFAVSRAYGLSPADRILQFASISFDVAAEEIFPALSSGAAIVMSSERVLDGDALRRMIEDEKLSVLNLPAPFWQEWVRELAASVGKQLPPGLRLLIVGSERVALEAFARWRKLDSGVRLINAYGTSETTITSTLYETDARAHEDAAGASLPIGRPIANTRVYILDGNSQPAPPGIPGELYIGGAGVARGYLHQPALTAERFTPDPFTGEAGARLYRTGDRARFLPDGQIEFLGRVDQQVKVRGYRIEPGEIEAALRRHPAVREAFALVREDTVGDKRLVAYVTQNADARQQMSAALGTELEEEQLSQWRMVHDDEVFNEAATLPDPTFNISGWNSSYTGQPIPVEEMREWVDDAVKRILSHEPRRVLEIGCGTGLLLFRIAPHCQSYVGTDFSPAALRYVAAELARHKELYGEVELLERRADDFHETPSGSFDAVILNSVAQYFPSVEYLSRVLEGAVRATARGGFVFVGDVRSLPLLEAFHTSVELAKADAALSVEQLQELVRRRIADEEELVIDPAFFDALKERLPQISHVEILPKRGRFQNEMTRFRYQVVIHVGPYADSGVNAAQTAAAAGTPPAWLDWQKEPLGIEAIGSMLESGEASTLGIERISNARVSAFVKASEMMAGLLAARAGGDVNPPNVGELREMLRRTHTGGIDPEELWTLGEKYSYQVDINWARQSTGGRFDALFRRRGEARASSAQEDSSLVVSHFPREAARREAWSDYANNPLQGKFARYLVPQLRSALAEQLPEYMLPSAFVLLDAWPLTPGGKIDLRALPAPDKARRQAQGVFVAPRTSVEQTLAGMWAELLGLARAGVDDNFFELGGHSLLATQLVSRVREKFRVEIALRQLFEHPTVAGFATVIEQARTLEAEPQASPIVPVSRQSHRMKRSAIRRAPK